ncbi:MAG TPA: N-acetylglucosamine-6-phosphate deacetylase [Pyrinomonadaceae bacterium]|jgi:N-acetylglucosamine-6-phosphate deacetylase
MKSVLLKNATAILPFEKAENVSLLVENGKIVEIERGNKTLQADRTIDLSGATVFAGFIDIHIHGAVGVDAMTADAGDLRKMAKFLASKGTTAWLPTFVPAPDDDYRKSIAAIDELMETQGVEPIAQALGVHYEGVFASEKMCGALRPEFFKKFTGDEVEKLPRLKAENAVHLTTFAPEIEGGIALVKDLIKHGWIASIGHTRADAETLDRAFAAGAKHMTHFFNAMTGLHHREVGVVGWGLTNEKITCDIIADGIHVHPKMLRLAHKIKTSENLMLISDAVSPTGLGDGEYEIWNEKVSVREGRTENERGSIAGSVITLLDAVKQMLSLGIAEREVSRMASLNPAKLLGVEDTQGSIETGKRADLVALDENRNVKLTLTDGRVAFVDF